MIILSFRREINCQKWHISTGSDTIYYTDYYIVLEVEIYKTSNMLIMTDLYRRGAKFFKKSLWFFQSKI